MDFQENCLQNIQQAPKVNVTRKKPGYKNVQPGIQKPVHSLTSPNLLQLLNNSWNHTHTKKAIITMANEIGADEATQLMMKKLFRRSSITPAVEYGKIKSSAMPVILNQMGQKFDEADLNKWISKLDPNNTGTLDFDSYTLICSRFLRDPAAIVRGAQDEFSFRHLIGLPDFANP